MQICLYPEGTKNDKCLLLVGGAGDSVEIFEPFAKQLSSMLSGYTIATTSLSAEAHDGAGLLELQAKEVERVMGQIVAAGSYKTYVVWCTSMGAYATVKLLVGSKYGELLNRVIFFDPADYYLSSRFSTSHGEQTWSGHMTYEPSEPLVSDLLKGYKGQAKIDVVHLTLRNYGRGEYLQARYQDRGSDDPTGYPRLNSEMVRQFYENTPLENRGTYREVKGIPHGFVRDGAVESNLQKIAGITAELL